MSQYNTSNLTYNTSNFWNNPSLGAANSGGSFWNNPSATYGQTGYLSGNMSGQQFFGTNGIGQGGGNWFQSANNWMGNESFLGGGISNGALANAGMGVLNMGVNMLAGQNHSTVGDIMQGIGGLASNIPGVGGLIGGAVGVVGGLINAAFGSHINEEFVKQQESMSNSLGSRTFNDNTNADVLNDWKSFITQSNVSKSEVGSDGWFSNKASRRTRALNEKINAGNLRQWNNFDLAVQNADANTDLRILSNSAAYGGPINSFRKYYANGGSFNTPQFFTFEPQTFDDGGYLSKAKALIRQNEGFMEKPYADSPKGKNWRSVGYGFNDSGFREKYPEGISKHYEHGITKKQAEEELNYFLNKAEKQLKSIYGKQWNDFTDSQKAAILDTYYQRPASVGKSSRFYKAVTAGEDPSKYLGVAGFNRRNSIRQNVFSGGKFTGQGYSESSNTEDSLTYPSSILEATSPIVDYSEAFSGVTPTQVKALELNLTAPNIDFLTSLGQSSQPTQLVPTVGTVEDFLASYDDYNIFDNGGWMDFFNAWNSAQGGSQGAYGSNWKPYDGLQKNTSNGNAQDWLGVAGTVVNTIGNWGKEDPSLGRGGGYSTFGMAAYDVMKAIRNATKSKRESIDQKLGIPIYARGGRLFADGGSVGAMGYAQIGTAALKLASNAVHQASLDDNIDEDTIHRSINRYGMGLDEAVANVDTNGDLLDLWQNNSTINPNLSARDFRDKSYFDDFLDSYAASWEGFNAGQNFGPWGAAIGAIVGGGSSVIGSIIGRNKASNTADETNEKIERANERRMGNLLAAAERVDQENDFRMLQNMGANGGKLNMGFNLMSPFIMPDGTATPLYRAFGGGITHGVNWDTGINWVDEGGSHGDNPLGGVPYGVDQSGVPNLVEEGEAVWNGDYVFSRRMKVPKKLRDKYKLPDNATFADAVKVVTKESEERPNDEISRATQDHILGEFADSQEELRAAKAQRAMDRQMQLQDDFLMGMQFGLGGHITPQGIIPTENNFSMADFMSKEFASGGGIHIDPSKRGTFKAQASKMGMGVQEAASHILANKENYSPAMVKKANFARNASHWHEDGGSLFENPFGEVNTFDGGGYIWDLFWQKTNASSKKKGNSKSKYRIDDSYTGDIKALEDSEHYKAFTNYILNEASDEERLKYFRWIDDNTGRERTYTNKKGELLDGWQEKFKEARNDGLYGIQHYTPVKNAGTTGTTSLTDLFGTIPVDTSLPEQGLVVFDPKIMGNPEAMAAGTRTTTTDENGTKVTRVTGNDKGLQRSPFKPKQTWTRYAPIAMNALFGLKEMLTPADYTNANAIMDAAYQAGQPVSVGTEYIGDYRKRDPFDPTYLMNTINQNAAAANRNFMNISGGNRAVAMSGILANDLITQRSLAEAARQAYLANRADDAQVAEFNRGTNIFNAQAQNTRNLSLAQLNSQRQNAMLSGIAQGARLRQAIKDQRDAAISANLTNFAQGLGDLGKENGFYNMLGGLNEEGILKYFYGDDWKTKFNNVNV